MKLNEKQKRLAQEAVEVWGFDFQILLAVEELAELQKELLKKVNRKRDNLPDVINEIADAEIMLEQVKHMYGIHDQVDAVIVDKFNRLEERIEKQKAKGRE